MPELNEKVCVVAPCTLDTYLPLLTLCRGVCWALHPVGMCELPIDSRATICGMSQPRYGGSLGQRASKFWRVGVIYRVFSWCCLLLFCVSTIVCARV